MSQEFVRRGYRVVLLVDNQKYNLVDVHSNPVILTWPSKRPIYFRDAMFLQNAIYKYRPHCVIGNFGSDNICTLVGWLNKVPHRWVWYHTISQAIDLNNVLSKWEIKFLRYRKKMVYRFNTQVISVSHSAASDLRENFNVPLSTSETVLHCLLDDNSQIEKNKDISLDSNLVICVARLVKFKGQETLIRAAQFISKTKKKVRFEFIGDGPDRQYFEDLAVSLNINNNCVFTGNLSRNDVLNRLASADIFVMPSYADAFPLVNLEALSMGIPVIASDIGGIREQIINGKFGALFPPGNSEILAEKILEILNNINLRQAYSVAAREHFLQNFSYASLPKQVDQLENILAG
jgi:glycosyltransferase involved in cell wall biosynthesis